MMFYSSDPTHHDNSQASSNQDKYSSIRVLDQSNKNMLPRETSILGKFSCEFSNERRKNETETAEQRPYATLELGRGTYLTPNDQRRTKSFSMYGRKKDINGGNGDKSTDSFSDILQSARHSFYFTFESSKNTDSKADLESDISEDTNVTSDKLIFEPGDTKNTCCAIEGDANFLPSGFETVVSNNWSAVKEDMSPVSSESRVSSPRYHTLTEDELEEELLEEEEVRSRNDSVILRHEIIRSFSVTENHADEAHQNDKKNNKLNEADVRKGYVALTFDVKGTLREDDHGETTSPSGQDKPGNDFNIFQTEEEGTLDIAQGNSSNNSTTGHDQGSLSEHQVNVPGNNVNREHGNQMSSSRHDNAPKRLTVDIGELRRQSDGQSKVNRAKHISVSGGTVREIKFLRSPTTRVSTLFSTKIPEIRGSEKQKSNKAKAAIEPGFLFFGDGLFDFTEERNEEAVAFSTEIGNLRSKICGKVELNLGYLLSPTVTQNSHSLPNTLEEVTLSLEIFIQYQELPVRMNCSSKTCVSEVLAKVLQIVWRQNVNPDSIINSAYTLKVCGYQEYLSSLSLLCEYEYVHRCVMARQTVRLVLLDSDQVPRSLARSELDDVADCEPRIYSQFFERSLDTSVSRDGLSVLREAFEEELKRVLQDADSLKPCFQPGRLIQSVRAVCTTLGQIETKGIVNSVYSLKEMKKKYDKACEASSNNVDVNLKELRSLLQDLYRHVYLLIELYCNTFNTDFGRICISGKIINGSIEVTAMTEKFSIYISSAYRVPPDWKEKFESYVVEGKIYYGTNLHSVPEYTIPGKIRTNFFAQISWQCFMEFGIELRNLPRESKLCLTLYGVSPPPKNATMAPTRTPLGWTAVQLFDFNGVLVSGSQLFGLWPNQAANPLGTCTSNLIDKRSAILQVDFPQHMSDIVFPALKIPEREADGSETPPKDLFNKFLSRDMFEDLRPEDTQMIWKNRLYASMVWSVQIYSVYIRIVLNNSTFQVISRSYFSRSALRSVVEIEILSAVFSRLFLILLFMKQAKNL